MADIKVTLVEHLVTLIWACLSVPIFRNGLFTELFFAEHVVTDMMSSTPFTFCHDLLTVMRAETPPTIEWFKTLHSPEDIGFWGVYALVLEKLRHRPRVYIGSGTQNRVGIRARWLLYERAPRIYRTQPRSLPKYVVASLHDGYKITHMGSLMSCPMPISRKVPMTRLLIIAIEATMTFFFWAIRSTSGADHGMGSCCYWPRDSFTYDGLCSHNALKEIIAGNFDLSEEQLESMAAANKEACRVDRAARYQRDKVERPDVLKATSSKADKKYWRNAHGKAQAKDKRRCEKAKAAKKNYCSTCDLACIKKLDLEKHLQSKRHLDMVSREQAGIQYAYQCTVCPGKRSWQYPSELQKHYRSERHKKEASKAKSRASTSTSSSA